LPQSEFFKSILDNLYDGVYFLDLDRRITYWNNGAERITGFSGDDVLGKHCSEGLLIHMDPEANSLCSTDRCPALKAMRSDEPCEAELFCQHKAGYKVPVVTRVSPIKEDGEVIGAVEVFSDNTLHLEDRRRIGELEKLALLDPLTGVGNRRHAQTQIEFRLTELRGEGWQFGILYLDIDHFKEVNDTYGHDAGDAVLKAVARTIRNVTRAEEIVARWGGEEFVVAIDGVSSAAEMTPVAEKLRRLIEGSVVVHGGAAIRITVSIGMTRALEDDTTASVVARADALMYRSKEAGRNRVTVG
jgi:diguanylate cyclase (GGDEF)-like protein/PAS domain S-box-containing protein